jgi:hypothetical protein
MAVENALSSRVCPSILATLAYCFKEVMFFVSCVSYLK